MCVWEQLHTVWPRAKHLLPSAVAHREGPELGGSCKVFGEPSGPEGWTAPRHRSDVLTGNLPLKRRRAETKTEAHLKHVFFMNIQFSCTFHLVPCFRGGCRAAAATTAGLSEPTARSRLSAALCLTPPTSAQTSRFPAAGMHSNGNEMTFIGVRKLTTNTELDDEEPEISLTFRTSRVSRMAAHWEDVCARRAALWKSMKLSGLDWS